jgi:hypothetical protein
MTDIEAPGVWISIAELGRRRGISRASAKERVDRLESQGLVTTRRDGKARLVELAAFDRATGYAGDPAKELGAETARQDREPTSSAYRDAQTDRARYEAQLKALDLAERQGKLLPIDGPHGIEAAASAIGVSLARELDGLPRRADDIAAAVSREGVAGARRILKEIGTNIRNRVTDALMALAAEGEEAERAGPITTELFNDEGKD